MKIIDCSPFIFIELIGDEVRQVCYFVACIIFVIYVMFVFSTDLKNGETK